MTIVTPWFLKTFAGPYVQAMALFPFILIRNAELRKVDSLIRHEKIHWRQQLELLIVPFYILYLLFYLYYRIRGYTHSAAYRRIPFEREAYSHDHDIDYLSKYRFYHWIHYL